jgi:hypothetical protein
VIRSLRTYALLALVAVVVGVLENVLFGADAPGTRQQVSVGFFFLAVAGIAGLVVVGIFAAVRRVRASEATR